MATLTQTNAPCTRPVTRRISFFDLMSLARQRRALASLSTEQLEDLGLTRAQALAESRRPLLDIPFQRHFNC